MNRLDFIARATTTGWGGMKLPVPTNAQDWINKSSPGLIYLEHATAIRNTDNSKVDLVSPRLSKDNYNKRYILIPKDKVNEHSIKTGDMYQVTVEW